MALSATVFGCQCGHCEDMAGILLADGGRTSYRMVVGTNRLDRLAADELVELFEKGTGARLSDGGRRQSTLAAGLRPMRRSARSALTDFATRRRLSVLAAKTSSLSDRKSTRLNSSHPTTSRMPSSA